MKGVRLIEYVAVGLAATWFMDRVDKVVYNLQAQSVHDREAELEDLTGPGQLARVVMRTVGHEPTHDEAVAGGRFVHVAFGVSTAVAYGFLSDAFPPVRRGAGLLFGLALSPANLVVVPALGLTPPTSAFPVETSIRSVLYHLGYGFALESLARFLHLHDAPAG